MDKNFIIAIFIWNIAFVMGIGLGGSAIGYNRALKAETIVIVTQLYDLLEV